MSIKKHYTSTVNINALPPGSVFFTKVILMLTMMMMMSDKTKNFIWHIPILFSSQKLLRLKPKLFLFRPMLRLFLRSRLRFFFETNIFEIETETFSCILGIVESRFWQGCLKAFCLLRQIGQFLEIEYCSYHGTVHQLCKSVGGCTQGSWRLLRRMRIAASIAQLAYHEWLGQLISQIDM